MSATKSATDCRRAADPYGARSASRTAPGSGGRESAAADDTKIGVRTQATSRNAGLRTSRINPGAAAFGGTATPVLASTTPATWSR